MTDDDAADQGVALVENLVLKLGIPALGTFGLTRDATPDIVEMARRSSSMKFNPVRLPASTLSEILLRAL